MARLGAQRPGSAWLGPAGCGRAWHGVARLGGAWRGWARHGAQWANGGLTFDPPVFPSYTRSPHYVHAWGNHDPADQLRLLAHAKLAGFQAHRAPPDDRGKVAGRPDPPSSTPREFRNSLTAPSICGWHDRGTIAPASPARNPRIRRPTSVSKAVPTVRPSARPHRSTLPRCGETRYNVVHPPMAIPTTTDEDLAALELAIRSRRAKHLLRFERLFTRSRGDNR